MDEEASSDEVVMEVPIFSSTYLEDRLWVFRYKHMTRSTPRNAFTIKKAYFKPNNEMASVELENAVYQSTFEEDRAVSLAEEVNGAPDERRTDKVVFENNLVDKTILHGVKEKCDNNLKGKDALLVYDGQAVHLAELKGVMELEPQLGFVSRRPTKKRDKNRNGASDEEDVSEARQVTVKFQQGSNASNDAQSTNAPSYDAIQNRMKAEPWISCRYENVDSVASQVQRTMFCHGANAEPAWVPHKMDVSKPDYLGQMTPAPETQKFGNNSNGSTRELSLHKLRQLPVPEQCKLLLKNVKSMAFQQIMIHLAGDGVTSDLLLRTLPQVAVLVRGNWVVKSEILYPPSTESSIRGVKAENMCRARDYMLYLFTKNQYVERKKIASLIKIPSEELEYILKGIASQRYNKGWEMSSPSDHEFMTKHADIVQRQNELWEERFRQISEYLKLDAKRQRRKSKSVSEDPGASTSDAVQRIRTGPSMSSDNDSGTEKKDKASPKVAKRLRKVKISDDNSS